MLLLKMLRDLKNNKTQFISIFLMAFLGVFTFTGVSGEWVGLQKTADRFYTETNLPDIWLYGNNFSLADAEAVEKLEQVTGVQRRLTLDGVAQLGHNPDLVLHFIEENEISRCLTVTGEDFTAQKDGIWLDDMFAEANELKTGDAITVTAYGITLEKKILGTVLSPEYVFAAGDNDIIPNHANYGFAYISAAAFPAGIDMIYTDLLITTDRSPDTALEESISAALKNHYSVYLTRDNFQSYSMFYNEIQQHKAMGSIFPVFFLAIAMLTILTTMTRMVNNQRTQIGTLKALGFHRKHILLHYISYGFWLSLAGALLGAVTGPFTLPLLFYKSLQTTYTLPEWKPGFSPMFILMALLTVCACTLATYSACISNLKDSPAQTLRPKAPKAVRQGAVENTNLWAVLGFNIQWNLRDIFRSRIRSLMAVAGVLGCSALLVCAFGMKDSLDDVITWQYEDLNRFETKLILSGEAAQEQIDSILELTEGEALMEGAVEIKANGIKKSGSLLVQDNVTLMKATGADRKLIDLPSDSLSISYKMAELLGVKAGDTISWHIYGDERWVTGRIGAVYRTPVSQGITLSRELFEEQGFPFTPTSVITSRKVTVLPDGADSAWSADELTQSYISMTEAMNILVYVLIAAAVLLAVVVLYNLGILSFTERQRELATLKVIGFQSKKICRLLLTQNIWFASIGLLIGIPLGKWLIDIMLAFLGDSFDMMSIITISNIALSTALTFLLSILVNLMFLGKIKRIDMVSSLKGVE